MLLKPKIPPERRKIGDLRPLALPSLDPRLYTSKGDTSEIPTHARTVFISHLHLR